MGDARYWWGGLSSRESLWASTRVGLHVLSLLAMASRFLPVTLLFLWVGLGLTACGHGERPQARPETSAAPNQAPAVVRLAFLTDLQGYLEPCGCQSTSLGGIDRAAAELRAFRVAHGPTPLLAVGATLFEDGGLHQRDNGAARTQEIWKAETIVDILGDLSTAAIVSGSGDELFGRDTLQALRERAGFPLFSPPEDTGAEGGVRAMTIKAGPHVVGVLAITAAEQADVPIARWSKQAAQEAAALRAQGAVLVVGLTVLPARETRRLATSVAGLDFVVAAGRDRDEASPPEQLGQTTLLTGPRHGRGLLLLEATVHERAAAFRDESAWTRAAEEASRKALAADLEARIATWERDPQVDSKLLATQKQRLEDLRAPSKDEGQAAPNRFEVQDLSLPTSGRKDPHTSERMATYDARVNRHNREAFADRKPPAVLPGGASYIGSEACKGCHQPAFAWWTQHAHGRAYDTLRKRNKEYNLSCVGCHVTGYEQPGGSTVTHNEGLIHVGCESCHGPGSLHLGDPKQIVSQPAETVCVQCHNHEHSDLFEFDAYRKRLLAPGHGLPPAAAP